MRYAYLDESGTVAPAKEHNRFFVVVVVAAAHGADRAAKLHIKRLRESLRPTARRARSELKGSEATSKQMNRLLHALAGEDIAIAAVTVDKHAEDWWPADSESLYREAAAKAIYEIAERWPQLRVVVDKRYTKAALRRQLEEAIKDKLRGLQGLNVSIEHADSRANLGLQVVDHVAWALRQHYEVRDNQFYDLIKEKLVAEIVIDTKGKTRLTLGSDFSLFPLRVLT